MDPSIRMLAWSGTLCYPTIDSTRVSTSHHATTLPELYHAARHAGRGTSPAQEQVIPWNPPVHTGTVTLPTMSIVSPAHRAGRRTNGERVGGPPLLPSSGVDAS